MSKYNKLPFIDPKGRKCFIEEIGMSELGYTMLKLYYPKKKVAVTYIIDVWDPKDNFITRQIKKFQKLPQENLES